jgi:hypothetical protein
MAMIAAEVLVDGQHGPVVRVSCGGSTVSVYLMDETGTVTSEVGQYGVEVSGPWVEFKNALPALTD